MRGKDRLGRRETKRKRRLEKELVCINDCIDNCVSVRGGARARVRVSVRGGARVRVRVSVRGGARTRVRVRVRGGACVRVSVSGGARTHCACIQCHRVSSAMWVAFGPVKHKARRKVFLVVKTHHPSCEVKFQGGPNSRTVRANETIRRKIWNC